MLRAIACVIFICQSVVSAQAETRAAVQLAAGFGPAIALPGSEATLALTELIDDRCPSDVVCVWQGLIRVTLTLTEADGTTEEVILCNICPDATREAVAGGLPDHTCLAGAGSRCA